jgi:hypothetical protein
MRTHEEFINDLGVGLVREDMYVLEGLQEMFAGGPGREEVEVVSRERHEERELRITDWSIELPGALEQRA